MAAAAAFQITQGHWSRLERGVQLPSQDLAAQIASASGLSIASLLTGRWCGRVAAVFLMAFG